MDSNLALVEEETQESELSPEEQERARKSVQKWLKRIERERKDHQDYRDSAMLAWQVYLDDSSSAADKQSYPLLWSIVQIEHSAVFSQTPIPDVRPRNTERQPIYDTAANVMLRALEFSLDQTDFTDSYARVTDDYLVAALGVPRVKLDAEILGEGDEAMIGEQSVRIEHVPFIRFGWEPVTQWDFVTWIYIEHRLTPAEIKRRWGVTDFDTGSDETLSSDSRSRTRNTRTTDNRVSVYEIWDKRNREVITIAKGVEDPLEVVEDPLGLTNFFPVPKPLFLNLPSDELIPTTDYTYMQPFSEELNRLYKRGKAITEQIKAASLHDASLVEIEDWRTIGDGDSVPVEHLSERMEGGADLRKVIMFWPNEERVQTLSTINEQIALKRAAVDEMFGVADIVRGVSNAQDGVGTNQIKERWAGIRLRRKQVAVQHQIRDLFRMMAEVLVEHVTPENLSAMTQIEVTPEIMGLLRDDTMREFAIDVETDSTVMRDEYRERAERTELLQAITQWSQTVAPAAMQGQLPASLAREILQIATDPYKKYSKGMNDVIEQLPDNMKQLQDLNQKLTQSQQQAQQAAQAAQEQEKKIQQLEYGIAQYSMAEELRKDRNSRATAEKDVATATKTLASVPSEMQKPIKTDTDIEKIDAEIAKIYNDIQVANRPEPVDIGLLEMDDY